MPRTVPEFCLSSGSTLKPLDITILTLLADGAQSYGYALAREAEVVSEGRYRSSSNLAYKVLDDLCARGLAERSSQDEGDNRIFYRLTPAGFRELRRELILLRHRLASASLWVDEFLVSMRYRSLE